MNAQTLRSNERPSLRLLPGRPVLPAFRGIARPRVVAQLDRLSSCRLILVTAPAGWGKTTAVREWVGQRSGLVAWCRFDGRPHDAISTLRQIVEAIAPCLFDGAQDVLPVVRTGRTEDLERALSLLHEALRPGDTRICVVLDDLAYGPGVADLLDVLLEMEHDALQLVIPARSAYPNPVSRMRLLGDVGELEPETLRFDLDEASRFWATDPHGDLDADAIAETLALTEGWAAGLGLMALSEAAPPGVRGATVPAAGVPATLASYLAEEVFASFPAQVLALFSAAALIGPFTAATCDVVLNRDDSQAVLHHLVQNNPFLMPIPGRPGWFRLHRMVGDYLAARPDLLPDDATVLHRRAAAWFLSQGMIEEAIPHVLAIHEPDGLLRVLECLAERPVLSPDLAAAALDVVARTPLPSLRQRPAALRFAAWLLVRSGRLDEARAMAEALRASGDELAAGDRRRLEADALSIESRIGAYLGDDSLVERTGEAALALLGSDDAALRADLLLSLGWIRRGQGDLTASVALFDRAARLGRQAGHPQAALWGTRYLALDWLTLGRLGEAAVLLDDEIDRIAKADVNRDFARAALLVGRAEVAYERNALSDARASIDDALAIAHRAADAKILMNAYVAKAWLDRACGDQDGAQQAALRAYRLFDGRSEAALLAFLALDRGNVAVAAQWAAMSDLSPHDLDGHDGGVLPLAAITYARLAAASGEPATAMAVLHSLDAFCEGKGWVRPRIMTRAWLAVLSNESGATQDAIHHIVEAVRLAAAEGYVRSLLDAGRSNELIVRDALRTGRLTDRERHFVLGIVGQAGPESPASALPDEAAPPAMLVEPLTERQAEILALLASGHSNREIASRLYVAEGTVKAHVHQICGKLMARNRLEAVAHARRLGLLTS